MIDKNTLILDIECDDTNKDTAALKFFGAYSYKNDECSFFTDSDIDQIQGLIDEHKYIVTFYGKGYDLPILERYGINFKYKIMIDLFNIIAPKYTHGGKGRCAIIKTSKGLMSDTLVKYDLNSIIKFLDLNSGKLDFDYGILKKDKFTEEEKRKILEYLKNDVDITKDLYEWIEDYFAPFKDFLTERQNYLKHYLTTTSGSYAYKVICNKAGLDEDYEKGIAGRQKFEGAYVSTPRKESAVGSIKCLDIQSAYPHACFMCNIHHPSKEGFKKSKILNLTGTYNDKELGNIAKAIKELYLERVKYKEKNDLREHVLKIVLNSCYGISGNSIFKSLFTETTGPDCTLIVRSWIKFTNKEFKKAGYIILYNDTDSFYLEDPFDDDKRLLSVTDTIVEEIKKNVPFPSDTFNLKLEPKIKYIQFFKDKKGRLMKKNYLYVTEDNKLVLKGLPMIKSNASLLSKIIFDENLKESIIKNKDCKFDDEYIKKLIEEKLRENISYASQLFNVKEHTKYKLQSQLQAQISLIYGPGAHKLIKNKKMGVGKKVKYCLVKEVKENNLTVDDLDLSKTWKELDPFVKERKKEVEKEILLTHYA